MTGRLIYRTACHSFQFSGIMEKRVCKIGVYKRPKFRAIDKEMAQTSGILTHNGRVKRDSEDDRAFIALNISITTSLRKMLVRP